MWKLYLVFNKSVNTVRNRPLKRYDKTTARMSSLYVLNTQPCFQLQTTVTHDSQAGTVVELNVKLIDQVLYIRSFATLEWGKL